MSFQAVKDPTDALVCFSLHTNTNSIRKKHPLKNNIFVNARCELKQQDNNFVPQNCCLVVLAHLLSSQDVILQSMFFLIFECLLVIVTMLVQDIINNSNY